jgi:RNAse (barnase) inhibitor barstar
MRELVLDGGSWQNIDDFYDCLFRVLNSPKWHGRNFNALDDSIGGGGINGVDPPFKLVIRNYDKIAAGAKQITDDFIDLVQSIAASGVPVEVAVEGRE